MIRPPGFSALVTPIIVGITSGIATLIAWVLLANALWFPYWQELRQNGMYTHDVDLTFLISFGPLVVGFIFALLTVPALIVMDVMRYSLVGTVIARMLLLVPAFVVFFTSNTVPLRFWTNPFAEVAVLVIGIGLGYLLVWQQTAKRKIV